MNIRLPNSLYQAIPLFCVLTGFFIVMAVHHPLAIMLALGLYAYSFWVLWKRVNHGDDQ